jgi:hypothetical protein
MDTGETVYTASRLLLGAAACFFAIMLWARTRDLAWMLVVGGTLAAYGETIYSIMRLLGIAGTGDLSLGSLPLASIALPCLPTGFFIAAFLVMVVRKYRFR